MIGKRSRSNSILKKTIAGIAIAVICGVLAIRNVSFGEISSALISTDKALLVWSLLPLFGVYLFRVLRWRCILASVKRVDLLPLTGITFVGFMAINLFPLRLGEVVRPLLLKQETDISLSAAIASIAVERVFEGLALVVVLFAGLGLVSIPVDTLPYLNIEVDHVAALALLLFGSLLLGLVLLLVLQARILRGLERACRRLPTAIAAKIIKIATLFLSGMHALKDVKRTAWVAFFSLSVWACVCLSCYLIFCAFDFGLPFAATFTVLAVASLGVMMPGAPGFVGTYELFVKSALALFLIGPSEALAFAITMHGLHLGFSVLMGILFLPKFAISWFETRRVVRDGNSG